MCVMYAILKPNIYNFKPTFSIEKPSTKSFLCLIFKWFSNSFFSFSPMVILVRRMSVTIDLSSLPAYNAFSKKAFRKLPKCFYLRCSLWLYEYVCPNYVWSNYLTLRMNYASKRPSVYWYCSTTVVLNFIIEKFVWNTEWVWSGRRNGLDWTCRHLRAQNHTTTLLIQEPQGTISTSTRLLLKRLF